MYLGLVVKGKGSLTLDIEVSSVFRRIIRADEDLPKQASATPSVQYAMRGVPALTDILTAPRELDTRELLLVILLECGCDGV